MLKLQFICKKKSIAQSLHNLRHYSWHSPVPLIYGLVFYIFFITLSLTIKSDISQIALIILLLIGIIAPYFLYKNYKAMPAKVAAKNKAYETAIIAAGLKGMDKSEGDEEPIAFLIPISKKVKSSIFNKKIKYIMERELKVVCLAKNHFSIFTGCSSLNILNPARKPLKAKCDIKPYGCGTSREYYYNFIRGAHIEAAMGARIGFISGDPSVLEIACEKPAVNSHAKPLVEALRKKLRVTQKNAQPAVIFESLIGTNAAMGPEKKIKEE